MEITETRLKANGWENENRGVYTNLFRDWLIRIYLDPLQVFFDSSYLPRIRTLEALTQLEYLLGDEPLTEAETMKRLGAPELPL